MSAVHRRTVKIEENGNEREIKAVGDSPQALPKCKIEWDGGGVIEPK